MAPTRVGSVLRSPVFSWAGKLRMALEPLVPRRSDDGDESLASFVRRRLGREVLERVAQPLIGGIYASNPETLSLAATMPRFLEMERNHGSVILGTRRAQKRRAQVRGRDRRPLEPVREHRRRHGSAGAPDRGGARLRRGAPR